MVRRPAKSFYRPAGWLWLLLALLAGCSDPQPTIAPLPPDAAILAFGDSLTAGNGAPASGTYPAALHQLTGRTVINAGVPGEVSADGLRRLPALLEQHQPALLILCHGGNDLIRKLDPQRLFANLQAMVELARARGTDVLLVGVPRPKLFFLEPAALYDRLATEMKLPYLRDTLPELESEPAMKSDAIHLNGRGYRKLAEAIHRLLQESGALD